MEPVSLFKKFLYGALIFVGVFSIGIGSGYIIDHYKTSQTAAVVNANTETSADTKNQTKITNITNLPEVKLTFTGDININSNVKNQVKQKLDGDYEKIFGAAEHILQSSDITFGNFNGTFGINDSARADAKSVAAMRNAGFDILSMSYAGANRTVKNLIETSLVIDGNGLGHTGAGRDYQNAREVKTVEKNGMTIGYLTFTDNKTDWPLATEDNAGLLWANDPQLEEIISTARSKSDVLVVSFNWAEKSIDHTLREELLAHTAIDAGATIVVGHLGNNLQDIEYYHGGLIAYNLGTLISSSGAKPNGIQGFILETGIRGGVINTVNAYGVVENKNGFIDSVSPISVESLIREKGVINNQTSPEEAVKVLPPYIASEIVTHGPDTNKVAITIDDGWSPSLVKKALDILSEKSAKATFFPVTTNADVNKLNLIRAVTNGIELGNHTDAHGWLTQMDDTQIKKEIDTWQTKIDNAIGRHYNTKWFRPPFMAGFSGHTKTAERVTAITKADNLKIALWSLDPYSGISMKADAQAITAYLLANVKPGSIILLHFSEEHMVALPDLIDGLRAKGYELVTLSNLISE